MQPETESIELNLNHLLCQLKLPAFQKLDAEGQVGNIEETRSLLKTKTCPYSNKRQLIDFLKGLKRNLSKLCITADEIVLIVGVVVCLISLVAIKLFNR